MDLDLGNGNGSGKGGNDDAVAVDPADPQKVELQPLTRLRAAPLIAAVLAGVALLAVFLVRADCSCTVDVANQNQLTNLSLDCGSVVWLLFFGLLLVLLPGLFLAAFAIVECDRRAAAAPRDVCTRDK